MKSQCVFEDISFPGMTMDVGRWFGVPISDAETIEAFLHLALKTWELVNGEKTVVLTLDGETWLLYLFCDEYSCLRRFADKFGEFTDDFNQTLGSDRNN